MLTRFRRPRLLLGVVEHRVVLDTPQTPSQNDLWCVLLTEAGQASAAVEAKSGEDFDKRLDDWQTKPSAGKAKRLEFLCDQLEIRETPGRDLRYQLFHRAASAVIEAKRWGIQRALMLVQSFAESRTSWDDYVNFARLLGITATKQAVCGPTRARDGDLYLAWVDSPRASDKTAAAAV